MDTKSSYIDFYISTQYDISCAYITEHCPIMKHFGSYIGVNIGARYESAESISYTRRLSDGNISQHATLDRSINTAQIGLSHTVTYHFNRIFISSVASYIIQPWSLSTMYMNSGTYPDSKLSLRVGLGYRLF